MGCVDGDGDGSDGGQGLLELLLAAGLDVSEADIVGAAVLPGVPEGKREVS